MLKKVVAFFGATLFVVPQLAMSATPNTYKKVAVHKLNLNRKARNPIVPPVYPRTRKAFIWNKKDNRTLKFRPQGITLMKSRGQKYLIVSWYGKKSNMKRGAKISIVNITKLSRRGLRKGKVKYRHVLLLDKKYKPFYGKNKKGKYTNNHVGGLHYIDGKLHSPDTSGIHGKNLIHVFSMDSIQEVPSADRAKFFNYRYILRAESSYQVSIKPSFLSYDWSLKKFVTGSFHFSNKPGRLQWYTKTNQDKQPRNVVTSPAPFFKQLQGAVSYKGMVYISASFGTSPSRVFFGPNRPGQKPNLKKFHVQIRPFGLEDMHMTRDGKSLWTLTEFSPKFIPLQQRGVFAINTKLLHIPGPTNNLPALLTQKLIMGGLNALTKLGKNASVAKKNLLRTWKAFKKGTKVTWKVVKKGAKGTGKAIKKAFKKK